MPETILVVDDEDDIGAVVRQMLAAEGYVVRDAADPHQALRLAAQEPVDLLITDVVMPRMRGTELAQRLLAVAPAAKVLLMSAYKVAEVDASGYPFIAKPFTPQALTERVRLLLRDARSPFSRKPPGRPGG
jgi:DNA-binding response OmpR family regulator